MNGLSEMMESPVLMSQCYFGPVEKATIEISVSRCSNTTWQINFASQNSLRELM